MSRSKKAQARSASPSAVTLGETSPVAQRAKVDWFTFTWRPEPDEHISATIVHLLRDLGLKVEAESKPGRFGYCEGILLFGRLDDGGKHHLGELMFGGDRMKGRARLDLSGSACSRIADWQPVQTWCAEQWEPTITRVDLAVDCLQGEFTVEDARGWLDAGEFTAGEGRPPRHSTPGDWLSETPFYGRTLEVGRRENGKMLRAYEKGLQLAPGSGDKWTRFEVELRARDRDIPLDVLTRCDDYFAGAYECLQRVVMASGERIATHQKEGDLTLVQQCGHMRNGYGKLLTVLRGRLDIDELLDFMARPGVPRRLEKSSLAGFNAAEAPAAYLREQGT